MKPIRLTASGLGRFPNLDLEIPEGCAAIVGPNGAGKSTLLNCFEVALFADGSRDLAPLLGPWSDRLTLEMEFEHADQLFRVRQSYKQAASGRGTATVDFEAVGGLARDWYPLTAQSADATRDLIVQTIGLGRRTFRASSFLAQGDAAAFTEASPADRKAILGEVLDPRNLWPRLAATARDRGRQIDAAIVGDRATADHLTTTVEELPRLREASETLERQELTARAELTEAEQQLDTVQAAVAANAAAVERHLAASVAVRTATEARDRATAAVTEATTQANQLRPARELRESLTAQAARIPELEAKDAEQRDAQARVEAAKRAKADASVAVERQKARVLELRAGYASTRHQHDETRARLNHLAEAPDGSERCTACEQLLGKEAKEAAMRSLQGQLEALEAKLAEQHDVGAAAATDLATLEAEHDIIEIPAVEIVDVTQELAEARSAANSSAALAVKIEQYELAYDRVPDLVEELRAAGHTVTERQAELDEAAQAMGDVQSLDQAVAGARQTVATRRNALERATVDLAAAREKIAAAEQAEKQLAEVRSRTGQAQHQLDLLKLAEKAYGRDGIPVLLVEQIIPQLETEANRILEQMPTSDGVVLNVELRTQRALKTDADKVRETLDILVADPDGQRAYETFSGGERARLNIALRIALAKLLAGRRGAESRLLAIDELEYLDQLGQGQLVDVVRSVESSFDTVLIVSHADVLRDAFDHVIEVEKRDGISAIAGAREPDVAAEAVAA
jgi:exonuclease SbcC